MEKWNEKNNYNVGDVVSYNSKGYECLATIPGYSNPPEKNTDWKEYVMGVEESILKPYVEKISRGAFKTNATTQAIIYGSNFDDTIQVNIEGSDIIINKVTPQTIEVDIKTSDLELTTDLEVSKSGIEHYGEDIQIKIVNAVIGTGKPGEFETIFSNATGEKLWGLDWKVETFGTCTPNSYFRSSKAGTPSGNTGPEKPISTGNYYMYTETSNPNNGVGNYGQVTTSNFANLQKIEFDYHMFGSGINSLKIESFNGSMWEEVETIQGSQQSSNSDNWLHYLKDVSDRSIEMLRLVFNYATSYQSDVALDNIKLTSI